MQRREPPPARHQRHAARRARLARGTLSSAEHCLSISFQLIYLCAFVFCVVCVLFLVHAFQISLASAAITTRRRGVQQRWPNDGQRWRHWTRWRLWLWLWVWLVTVFRLGQSNSGRLRYGRKRLVRTIKYTLPTLHSKAGIQMQIHIQINTNAH